jgi:DNA primase
MSLPNGFLDELRSRVTLSAIVGRSVSWDAKKSNRAKGDWWAPCPFHQEKTASFHVDDRKGFYYCFGCHAKGDALTFVKESQNMGFMEAVEALAREAGMAMPERDPGAAARADRRTQLVAVVEEAVKIYRLQLRTAAGAAARDYLARRKLSEPAQDRWAIGFAPDARTFLLGALKERGIAREMAEAAGVVARDEDGSFYDRFRGRIIFPVRDARGRAITLAGRAMDPNARAKYLNGPETEIFDKGRNLYNLGPAREAAGKGRPLIVAEGYMDVIALSEAGFGGAVAPMGTAVTEDQLRLMWKVADEPVIALDGDKAGIRAAMRVIDLALPMVEAGQGLRFAVLPEGQDPDDLIRAQGPAAMQAVLDAAQPMARILWRRETEGQALDGPERMAALRKRLRAAIGLIRDADLRRYYGEAFRQWEAELRPAASARRPPGMPGRGPDWRPGWQEPQGPLPQTKATLLATSDTARVVEYACESAILAVLLHYPALVGPYEGSLERLDLHGDGHADMLRAILAHHADAALRRRVQDAVGDGRVDKLLNHAHIRILPCLREAGADQAASDTLAEQLARLAADRALRKEIEEAEEDIDGLADEGLTWRLARAAAARAEADRLPETARTEEEGSAALRNTLDAYLRDEIWVKRRR